MFLPKKTCYFVKSQKWALFALANLAAVSTFIAFDRVWMKGAMTDLSIDVISNRMLDATETVDGVRERILKRVKPKPPRKDLIWLLSYPGAGADDIIDLVEHTTRNSMGTNYGQIMQTSDRARYYAIFKSVSIQMEHYKTGPWKNNVDFPAGTPNVLVKTYCTGYCINEESCTRINYIRNLYRTRRFAKACAKPMSFNPDRAKPVAGDKTYRRNSVAKSVVLTRSPMVIVTERYKQWAMQYDKVYNAEGLHEWCARLDDDRGNTKEIKFYKRLKYVVRAVDVESIPCYTEFLRIWLWYQRASEYTGRIVQGRHVSRHVIHYDDLKSNLEDEIHALLKYLGVNAAYGAVLPFDTEATDDVFFTRDEVTKIGVFMSILGKNRSKAWVLFDRYF